MSTIVTIEEKAKKREEQIKKRRRALKIAMRRQVRALHAIIRGQKASTEESLNIKP